jgi:hypothetical protein
MKAHLPRDLGVSFVSRSLRVNVTAFLLVALMGLPASAAGPEATGVAAPDEISAAASLESVAARPGATATAVRRLGLGVSMLPDRDLATYLGYKSEVGVPPATWSLWSNWGDGTGEFPTGALMDQLKADRTTPLIIWQPVGADHSDGTWSRYNLIAGYTENGVVHPPVHDAYIRRFARAAKAYQSVVVVRFAHEMDGTWFPWGIGKFDNTSTNFVAAWRHIWTIFRKVGATNVRFLWSPLAPNIKKKSLYPGDAYVNYAGYTAFNWYDHGRPWISMLNTIKSRYLKLSKVTRKPVIVAEMGTSPGDGPGSGADMAQWITQGYPAVYARFPNIKALLYFNVDMRVVSQPDWRVTPATSHGFFAYQAIANQSKFRGTIN